MVLDRHWHTAYIALIALMLVACAPPDDDNPVLSDQQLPQPEPRPTTDANPPGYKPATPFIARTYTFTSHGGPETTHLSVKNEDLQESIGATIPVRGFPEDCATAAAEAAAQVGIKASAKGRVLTIESGRASVVSWQGCAFTPRK